MTEVLIALRGLTSTASLRDQRAISEYEESFARTVGVRYAFSFAAGRMGLYALLEALDIGLGDEVILPAFTCVVVPNAILYRGARPVYVDIDARTLNLQVGQLEQKITPRTKAIIAQHTFGYACDLERVMGVADSHNIPVIEDCAHALGARFRGRPVGSIGTAALFSTDHTKVIGTGTGGMITTNDEAVAGRLAAIYERLPFQPPRRVRATLVLFILEYLLLHPRVAVLGNYVRLLAWRVLLRRGFFLDELKTAKPTEYPYPSRLSGPQALIGLSQLRCLESNLAGRRRLARLYDAEVGAYAALSDDEFSQQAFLRYSFLVRDRDAWAARLDDVLEMNVWFTSIAGGRENDLEQIAYDPGSCPTAEFVARHCVNLPTHSRVRPAERLIRRLRDALQSGDECLRLVSPSSLNGSLSDPMETGPAPK